MRLISLELTRYGNFAKDRIIFDPRPGRINLLFLPNGAGKSVLRAAFCDLLFGIGGQTPMGFRFGYTGMRIAAEAIAPDGARLSFVRRKGQGNTLLDAAGNPENSGHLARRLGGIDRTLLERLFALDTERLRRGGEELLASGGAVADALLAAGGLGGIKELYRSLEEAADALAPARRSKDKPFYRALDQLQEARRRARSAELRPEAWARMEDELAAAVGQQETANKEVAGAAREIARLERSRRVRIPMAERDAALAWLALHPEAPMLAPALKERLGEATNKLAIACQELRSEEERNGELAAEHAGIVADQAVLDAASEIEGLSEQAGAVDKALEDMPKRRADYMALLAHTAELLRRLDIDLPPERAGEALPHQAAESRARNLIARHGEVAAAAERAPRAALAAQRDIAEKEAQRDRLPPGDDTEVLARMVAEIRADGDPAARIEELARDLADNRAGLAAALAAVPGWRGDGEGLLRTPVQPIATYERLDAARQANEAENVRRADRLRDAEEQHAEAARRLAALAAGGVVADEGAVTAARRHREQGWALIYQLAFTAQHPAAEELRAFAADQPLPLAYERAVKAADALADRRVQDSDVIARAAEAGRTLAAAQQALAEAGNGVKLARNAAAEAERAWLEITADLPLGVAPGLEEVRAFLAARARVIEQMSAVERSAQAVARLNGRHREWAARLAAALGETSAEGLLASLLREADDRLAAASRVAAERVALEASLRELRRVQEEAERNLAEAARRQAAWQADWQAALHELNRPGDEHPDVTADILAVLAELDREHRAALGLSERLRAMQDDNSRFAASVEALLARVAPQLAPAERTTQKTLEAIRALRKELDEHRARAQLRADLGKQLEKSARCLANLRQRLAQHEADLQAVLTAIGAASVEDAEQRLALGRERAAEAEKLAQAETRLREDGDGVTLEALREELAGLGPDDVASALEAARARAEAAHVAAQEAAARASRQALEMQQRSTDVAYQAAMADQEAHVATIRRVLEEAIIARLAAGLLGLAIEKLEEGGGSALLARIGAYFRTLTSGAFSRIVAEDDGDGSLALAMVPSDLPDEQKRVDALSEGTRDQLYLALRLAAIEDHVTSAPALPFIGDDILQTSDDERATAALHALLEFSRHVQVILLTHHPHILRLAATLPGDAVHLCQVTTQEAVEA